MATLSDHTERTELPRIGVVSSRFHEEVCEDLLTGCVARLEEAGIASSEIEVVRVPGAFDIPFACQALANQGGFVALVALGCVVRGQTSHFEYVAGECARGVMGAGIATGIPIAFGVLTTDSIEQAKIRSDVNALAGSDTGKSKKSVRPSNKGWEAAEAALELAAVIKYKTI